MSDATSDILMMSGFGVLARAYDLALCDVWGVLHAGVAAFPAACEALIAFRAKGGTVILVSNAPRPSAAVLPQLAGLGVPGAAWDALVTSGDMTRATLEADPDRPYFWLGPERDGPLFPGLAPSVSALEAAALVVCTGLLDDTVETPADYLPFLRRARDLGLPFLCANPDHVVDRGGRLIYCAGALGHAYEELGGEAIYAGKPDLAIYLRALDLATSIRGQPTGLARVIAIGDALRTDIAGANRLGCDSLFIAHGIHAKEIGLGDGPLTDAAIQALLAGGGPRPTFAMERLIW